MKFLRSLAVSFVAMGALFAASFAQAGIITVTNDPTGTGRAAFGANDTMDWSTLGPTFTSISNPFIGTSNGGLSMTVSQSGSSTFQRRDQGNGWGGNFTDGSQLLWTVGQNGPVSIAFASAIRGVGFQINPDASDTSTTIQLFDTANVSLGLFNLTTNNRSTSSASFLGFSSSMVDIARISISQSPNNDFTINQLSLITTSAIPEPATLAIFGLGLAALGFGRRRKRAA